VPRDCVGELYSAADVFVLPTVSDGFAITQLEAMAHGVPVITTPNCGEVVEHGRNGYVVPARDARALADAILEFVRNPGLAAAMRPACIARAAEFSPDAYRSRLIEIIGRRVAAARGSTRSAA
jgi:glycosyltransferase involved in cell wall biosynthesis